MKATVRAEKIMEPPHGAGYTTGAVIVEIQTALDPHPRSHRITVSRSFPLSWQMDGGLHSFPSLADAILFAKLSLGADI